MSSLFPLLGLLLIVVLNAGTVWAQPVVPPTAIDVLSALSADLIEKRAAEVKASASLDDAIKAQLDELYRVAGSALESAEAYRQAAKRFEQFLESGPAEIEQARNQLAVKATAGLDSTPDLDRRSLDEAEQLLQKSKADLSVAEAGATEIKARYEQEKGRPAVIRQRVAEAKSQSAELQSNPPVVAADELPELVEARRWVNEARVEQLRAEILMLGQEVASQPMRLELLEVRRDLAEIAMRELVQQVESIETAVNRMRAEQAEQAKLEARSVERQAEDKHPLVAELAAKNSRLSEEIDTTADQIELIKSREREAVLRAQQIENSFNATRQKIEIAGLNQILGQVLQDQRRGLPDPRVYRKLARDREGKIAEATLAQILLEEERNQLLDLRAYVDGLLADIAQAERIPLSDDLAVLAESRRSFVDKALSTQRSYLQSIGELDIAERRLLALTEQFEAFLNKRLLWVRSAQPASLESARLIPGQVSVIVAPSNWILAADRLWRETLDRPWVALALVVVAIVWLRRRFLVDAIARRGQHVGNLMRDHVSDTLVALLLLALLALPLPLLMWVVGWLLHSAYDVDDFSRALGTALQTAAPFLYNLRLLQIFSAPGGVAHVHFGWPEPGLKRLHGDLAWFTPTLIVAMVFTILAFMTSAQSWGGGLGRALWVFINGLFLIFFFRLTHPSRGTLAVLLNDHRDHFAYRLRHVWFITLMLLPVFSAVIALIGFIYTSRTIVEHIDNTLWFVLLVVIVYQVMARWMLLNERRLRLDALLAKRKAEREAREAQGHDEGDGDGLSLRDFDEPAVDIRALDAASRRLIRNTALVVGVVGCSLIWQDMLPALRILEDVTLWSYTRPGVEAPVPITLSGLGLVLLVLVAMVVATRQLPAFIELTLLQRLDVSQGTRYTVTTLTKYAIVAVGLAWVFGTLGGSWSEIQWIFAALGVGIGFGLQEIVANFISGLIILFERPIRVGDVVTVGDTDGVVTRIRIRATTIRRNDKKELLVPNKNFITQELLNWSLSDQTTRIMINVGVAYGSDVEKAMEIMREAATSHQRIMSEPAPFVVFEEFGDNALLLTLRCYLDNIDIRLRTITELNLAIYKGMTKAGIEISFPQRDVHLDTSTPLQIRLQQEAPERGAT
ncbi:MAG: mechanosensitive ion channel [Gammaproteobacteria bacterium]|nr:mechanosensitive ion channel [Gammaproteobacteria bacterium]